MFTARYGLSPNITKIRFELKPFNAGFKSLRATLPAEIFLPGILIFKGLAVRRVYKSFGVKGLIFIFVCMLGKQ
jgi:hypothetical protein